MAVRGKNDPGWQALVEHWKQTQRDLREGLVIQPLGPLPRYIAGADAAYSPDKETAFAAAVVYDRLEQRIVEVAHAVCTIDLPYIPGFLSFREGPPIMEALGKLKHPFGVICFDGQGYAHPRRCGLATHVAVTLGVPGIGIAKSRYIGVYDPPRPQAGNSTPLMDQDEQIGAVVRTRASALPVFVSIGHLVDLPSAIDLALACTTRYRVPEPTRQADIEVAKLKKRIMGIPLPPD